MKIDINKFNELVEQGYLRTSEKDGLILFNYTDATAFEKNWTPETRMSRGLIVNKVTNEIVAKPMIKFFNLNEMVETTLSQLPDIKYTCYEKVDGSLGIIFFNPITNEWDVSTRGSFHSDQAAKAKQLMKQYNFTTIPKNTTLCVEIIYPENKIVVNYGSQEKLVLLSGTVDLTSDNYIPHYDPPPYTEFSLEELKIVSNILGMQIVKTYNYTIDEMVSLQKTLSKDEEGFVVRYSNGLRVKIKGDEYCRIHKILAHLSPLSLWEVMKNGTVQKEYLQQIPEELKPEFEPMVTTLEYQYREIIIAIYKEYNNLGLNLENTSESRKALGLFLKDANLIHSKAMFLVLLNQKEALDDYVMKQIRPKANEFKVM